MFRYAAIVCSLLFFASPAAAAELDHFFQGVRPLGMGGAFTAVADDENALFFNPAGLNKVDAWGFALINPLVDSSDGNIDFFEEVQDTDLDVTSEVTDLIRDHLGQNLHFRGALFPHFVMKNFAMGALGQVKANIEFRNPAFPEIEADALTTGSGHVGLGYGFFDDILRVGIAGKYVQASRLDQVYTASEIAASDFEDRVDDDLKDGSGFGVDVGVMATAPVLLKPTLAVVVQNVGDVDLGDAGTLPQQINLGASVAHKLGWFQLTGAADWIDVTNELGLDDDIYKRLHFGLEAKLPMILALRTGLYQGYGSFGATVDFKLLKLDYANYAEEIGSFAGAKGDRRHIVQVSLGW